MRDLHNLYGRFKEEYPEIHAKQEALGQAVHETAGPLPQGTRWLIKIAVSAAAGHHRALATHILKAREAGVSEAEIRHALLLVMPTCGFPAFMEAYGTLVNTK